MDSISFGKRVAFLRKKNEMTQIQLAEKLNVTNKAVSRWETGEGYPEITLLKPLAEILNTNVDYLLSNESNQSGELNKLNQLGESNSTDRFLDSEKKRRNDIFKNENQENCIAIENPFYYYMLAGFTVLFVLWSLYNLWNYIRTKSIQITIKYCICTYKRL